jgi:hypothetical protein
MSPKRGIVGIVHYGKMDYYNNPPWKHTKQAIRRVEGDEAAAWMWCFCWTCHPT